VALIDAWPPAILPLIKKLAPASSMTWSIQFAQPIPAFNNGWHLYRATIDQAAHGYGQTHAEIWNAHGQLIAVSSQLVAVFDN
jgi:acyl-CoA thioesterase